MVLVTVTAPDLLGLPRELLQPFAFQIAKHWALAWDQKRKLLPCAVQQKAAPVVDAR